MRLRTSKATRKSRKGIPIKSPKRQDVNSEPGIIFSFPIIFHSLNKPSKVMKKTDCHKLSSTTSAFSGLRRTFDPNIPQGKIICYPLLLPDIVRSLAKRIPEDRSSQSSVSSVEANSPPTPDKTTKPISRRHITKAKSNKDKPFSMKDLQDDSDLSVEEAEPESPSLSQSSQKSTKEISNRKCSSCGVRNTPCWRPGWSDSILLCNSCGLRHKKTRIHCAYCCYVPLKSELSEKDPKCSKCHQ